MRFRFSALLRRRHSTPVVLRCHFSNMVGLLSSEKVVTPSTTRIGTGVMGRTMAGHLIFAGYPPTVFNWTPSKFQTLLDQGNKLAASPADVARATDDTFLIVGYPSDVRRVDLDPSVGALSGLAPGSVLVDMTTSDPALAVEIADSAVACLVQRWMLQYQAATAGPALGLSRYLPEATSPSSRSLSRCLGGWAR